MLLTSPAFEHHQTIPQRHTCQGEDMSPPLHIQDVPKNTKSLVLIMDDPDAPHGTFDHWIIWNLPSDTKELLENTKVKHQGINHFGTIGYRGPCPPAGKPHRYFFKLYALDVMLDLPNGSSKEDVKKAMEHHTLDQAELIGVYQRK